MTFDLSKVSGLSVVDRERLDASLTLCSARHLADAVTAALDATGEPPRVPEWSDVQLGEALATAVLLFKSGGGDSVRVFKAVLCTLAERAAGRLADRRERHTPSA